MIDIKKGYELQQGKQTWAQLMDIYRFGYSKASIFEDFLDVCLFFLLSFNDNMKRKDFIERAKTNTFTGIYEDQYMQIVRKYKENTTKEKGKRPADYFANAWGALQVETLKEEDDILGEIYMNEIGHGEHGQFFTPSSITNIMAQLVGIPEAGEKVSDPCCGSGKFFISMGKLKKDLYFYGVDLSPLCAKMCVLNMWLFDLNADIYHGNSLSLEMYQLWRVRKGGYLSEMKIEPEKKPLPMPEPVKKRIQQQVKQQQLFDLDEVKKE